MSGNPTFGLEDDDFESLLSAMAEYGEGAVDIVSAVVHDAGDDIYREIDPLIHPSGRTFSGHTSGAQGTQWQRIETGEPLAVTVRTVTSRNYLYFPDDGSSTKRHYGDQQFMWRGADAAAPSILERGIDALAGEFERR